MRFDQADPALIEKGREKAKGLGDRVLQEYEGFIKDGVPDEDYYYSFLLRHPDLADAINRILISHSKAQEKRNK